MIEKRKYKKVVKGGGGFLHRRLQTISSTTEPDRCSTNYFSSRSDNFNETYSELLSQFKWNRNTKNAIKQYNEVLNQYNNGKKTGFFSKIVCRNIRNNKTGTCNTLKYNVEKARNNVLNTISQNIKAKIETRLNKIQRNPKTKRLDRLSCHIKLYTDLLNSSNCKKSESKDFRISKLITDLKAKFPKDPEFAEAYINYIMKKRENAREKLKIIQTDSKFSEELKSIIKSYPECAP